jgi:F-type H+-transporting ATPase subunit delta
MATDRTPSTDGQPAATFGVDEQRVARVYAEALLNAADRRQQADEVLTDLEGLVREVFTTDPQFEAFLSSSAIGRERKAEAIRKAFEGRAAEVFVNFLLVLNDHQRLDLLRPIAAAYRELRDERARRVRVRVDAAAPLAEDQRRRLEADLREAFRLEPVLDVRVDPELLGGLTVRVGDWLYDASVRSRLDALKQELIARSSHEIQSRRDRFSTPS